MRSTVVRHIFYNLSDIASGHEIITPWDEAAEFACAYKNLVPRTLIDKKRLFNLWQWSSYALSFPGDFAECGVYRGGSAYLLLCALRSMDSARKLHLFDTFKGMPGTDPRKDFHQQGDFADTSVESVRGFLSGFDNAIFHPGLFSERFQDVDQERFSFVHVDADLYSSVNESCEFFYPRLARGGVMVFDDYGYRSCPGARAAVEEFFRPRGEKIIFLLPSQALIIRNR
jgi:O-methyltransferase